MADVESKYDSETGNPNDKYAKELPRLRKLVEQSYSYFQPNYQRYNEFKRFVFKSSMSNQDIVTLQALKKPQLEFNILEAYISRQRGEFSKHEPEIAVSSADGQQANPETIRIVEDHMRALISEANNNGTQYDCYSDTTGGGFSALKVFTDYANETSFEQVIKFDRCYDPTLTGFDPMARLSHKGDGAYAFELFPKTKEEFERENPDVDLRDFDFARELGGFSWGYVNGKEKILLICDLYEKKKKRCKIVRLADGKTMRETEYKKLLKEWDSEIKMEVPPAVVERRTADITTICRWRFVQNKVLEYVETDFKKLPLIFVDGNSVLLREGNNGSAQQMTRPYVYHAQGIQKLKNYAGQTLANELENMVQHKFIIAKEAIPEGYLEAYSNVQLPSTLVYNHLYNQDPNITIPPPMPVPRIGAPAEVMQTFSMTDQMTQVILGNYDSQQGNINDNNNLSGRAIEIGAMQSNLAATPYVVGYLAGLNQVAQVVLDLIPKYYVTPRTIPVMAKDGKRDYVAINQPGGVQMQFDDNALQVKVEPGVSFGVQKARALQQIQLLMSASPLFAEMMSTKGLPILLDNIEIRGIDQLKKVTEEFIAEKERQAKMQEQMMMQQANQPNPEMLKLQVQREANAVKREEIQANTMVKSEQNAIAAEEATTERMKVMAELQSSEMHDAVQSKKADAEVLSHLLDSASKLEDQTHRHAKEVIETHHKGVELEHTMEMAKKEASKKESKP